MFLLPSTEPTIGNVEIGVDLNIKRNNCRENTEMGSWKMGGVLILASMTEVKCLQGKLDVV